MGYGCLRGEGRQGKDLWGFGSLQGWLAAKKSLQSQETVSCLVHRGVHNPEPPDGERMEQEQQRWELCKNPASKVISSHTKSLQPPFGAKWSFLLHSWVFFFFFSGCGKAAGSKGRNKLPPD